MANSRVPVTLDDLFRLRDQALFNETLDAWSDLILDWAASAVAEVVQLRQRVAAFDANSGDDARDSFATQLDRTAVVYEGRAADPAEDAHYVERNQAFARAYREAAKLVRDTEILTKE